ncbi:MAG: hypothetical protein J6I76_07365 [Oribacterium sp.]|nr:hypothetical protein [Oribacterium sp.]
MSFEVIWLNILRCEGQEFRTKTGKPFTYKIVRGDVVPDRTGFPLAKINFEKASKIKHLQGPGQISKLVMGSSYVYAILTDPRIRYPFSST